MKDDTKWTLWDREVEGKTTEQARKNAADELARDGTYAEVLATEGS